MAPTEVPAPEIMNAMAAPWLIPPSMNPLLMGWEASVKIDTEWEFRLAEVVFKAGRAPIPPERR